VAIPTTLFDASVLYAAPLRDLLLELVLSDLFRAKWTERINDEWISHLLANRPDLTVTQLARTRALMHAHVRAHVFIGSVAERAVRYAPSSSCGHFRNTHRRRGLSPILTTA
jgi:hypothetical protein